MPAPGSVLGDKGRGSGVLLREISRDGLAGWLASWLARLRVSVKSDI